MPAVFLSLVYHAAAMAFLWAPKSQSLRIVSLSAASCHVVVMALIAWRMRLVTVCTGAACWYTLCGMTVVSFAADAVLIAFAARNEQEKPLQIAATVLQILGLLVTLLFAWNGTH